MEVMGSWNGGSHVQSMWAISVYVLERGCGREREHARKRGSVYINMYMKETYRGV